ncbi:NAD(P)-dependent oxidoreductase [Bacillus sp. FJAT-47783]|uniref:NAD(P)-dependent oxidoreductase n=1 Tax=Bacillus sp. FJAT-47783 TaxID=2922712 RepID=UPI001FAD9BAA|nr:NAD(P)-dependent oxidoreductase [Bacillus sp. FJAT-47783]
MEKTVIGFIGTGVMGRSMATHLLEAGYPIHLYTRSRSKAEELLEKGAKWEQTIKEVAEKSSVIFTMVGYPSDVEEVYFGEKGLFAGAKPGSYLIDMTTSSPALAKKIYREAKSRQFHALDAPVSGGDIGAREAKLSIMVGGDEQDFKEMLPLFSLMGTNIVHQGEAGAGQHTKMCNQIAIASGMMGVCESVLYAEKAGLDPATVLKSIESGAAGSWSLSNYVPRIIAGNFEPGFYVKHFIKDMKIALQSAKEMGLETPGLKLAMNLYEELARMGEENSGTHALYNLYKQFVQK